MLRKFIVLSLILKIAFCVDFKSFVGIDASYVLGILQDTSLPQANHKASHGFMVAINSGDEYFWGEHIGLRSYFTLGYSNMFIASFNNPANLLDISLAIEPMLNFYNSNQNSFGIFGGMDVGYHYWANKERFVIGGYRHSFDFAARAGLSFLLMQNHRLETFMRLPFVYLASPLSRDIPFNFNFGIGYKYRY